jgi:hypothetical protein
VPITEDRFLDLCNRFLNKKALMKMEKLTISPPIEADNTGNDLIDAWNEGERNLRLVLCKTRADRMNKDFVLPQKTYPVDLIKIASAALETENPLEAEKFLLRHRLNYLETLRPMDIFSEEYIFYYALKLKLIMRIRRFDDAVGEATYKNIYNSILSGDRLEAQ